MSLLNFEKEEFKISDKDLELADIIKDLLIAKLPPGGMPKKAEDLSYLLSWGLQSEFGIHVTITPVKLRKWVSFFRSSGTLPLMATSEGYFITDNKDLIREQIISLEQRASQIKRASEGLKKFL